MQFMVLLVLRHALPVLLSGTREYSLPLLMVSRRKRAQTLLALQQRDSRLMYDFFARQLLSLRTVGIVLPIYIIVRVLTAIQRHRRQNVQVQGTSLNAADFPQTRHIALRFFTSPWALNNRRPDCYNVADIGSDPQVSPSSPLASSDEETENPTQQPSPVSRDGRWRKRLGLENGVLA